MFRLPKIAIALALIFPTSALAQATDLARELSQAFQSKQLKLKVPASGRRLKFDASGKRLKGDRGVSGFDDRIFVNSVELRERELRLKGTRMLTLVNPDTSGLEFAPSDFVEIKIELAAGTAKLSDVNTVLQNVFATPAETAARTCVPEEAARFEIPSYNRDSTTINSPVPEYAQIMCMPNGARGYRVAKNTKPPKPVSTPDPQYPLELRRKNVGSALVIFCALVDDSGRISDVIAVNRPGLSDAISAGEVLREWRFKPATMEGKPIPALINIEINLRLY
jgi:hypothetical protein